MMKLWIMISESNKELQEWNFSNGSDFSELNLMNRKEMELLNYFLFKSCNLLLLLPIDLLELLPKDLNPQVLFPINNEY
jgi:hypothetical protein